MSRNTYFIGSAAVGGLIVAGAFALFFFMPGSDVVVEAPLRYTEEEMETPQTTLLFVGDIMLSRSVGLKMEQQNEWRWPFLHIAEFLNSADITFGNLETTISDSGHNVGSIYSFRANPKSIEGLTYAGFDALSVANNHIGDWTQRAMEDTFDILEKNSIAVVGGGYSEDDAHTAKVIEKNGTRFGFLGYTDLGARYTEAIGDEVGIAWLDKDRMVEDIEKAKTIS
ncbi:MAG: CapA family protein, partial [Candidatus Spechtbacterales bacterium]